MELHNKELVRAALQETLRRSEMGFTERFEYDAERFYRETGLVAPGKSVPMEMWSDEMDRKRREKWDEFQVKLRDEFHLLLRKILSYL